MEQLLSKWAELAPDECKQHNNYWYLYPQGVEYQGSHVSIGIVDGKLSDWREYQYLLGATMHAIERRGWPYLIGYFKYLNKKYSKVSVPNGAWSGFTEFTSEDKNPAAALLSAYLKALEVS